MNKAKSSKSTTKRLVASGIMLFGGFLTFVNKPQDVYADDGAAPIKETNTTASESSNSAVLKSSVKSTSESSSKVETATTDTEGAEKEAAPEMTEAKKAVNGAQNAGAKSGINAETVTESSEPARTARVAAEPAEAPSKAPATSPVPVAGTTDLTKTVTIDGKTYKFTAKETEDSTPLFNNSVQNTADSRVHTYSYYLGDSSTSAYYIRKSNGDYVALKGSDVVFEKTADTLSKSFTVPEENIKVTETVTFTDAGFIEHTVTIKNIGTSVINNSSYGVMLDTMLDSNDHIVIHASGTGSAFIQNHALTLYSTGLKNVTVYAGGWGGSSHDLGNRVPVTGDYGKNLVEYLDSAVQYETGKVNINPGESYSFKFAERLYAGKHTLGKLTIRYVDTKGKSIRPNQVLGNVVGEDFKISPITIGGYTFQSSSIPLTGKYTEADQTLTLVYRDNKLPITKGQTTPTPKQKTPTPAPVVTTKTNKTLPQTGEKSGITASAIGVGILATLSLFGLAKFRRRENS